MNIVGVCAQPALCLSEFRGGRYAHQVADAPPGSACPRGKTCNRIGFTRERYLSYQEAVINWERTLNSSVERRTTYSEPTKLLSHPMEGRVQGNQQTLRGRVVMANVTADTANDITH